VATEAKGFDGLTKAIPAGQTIAAGANGGALTLDLMDQVVDLVKPGKPDALLVSKRTRRKLRGLRTQSLCKGWPTLEQSRRGGVPSLRRRKRRGVGSASSIPGAGIVRIPFPSGLRRLDTPTGPPMQGDRSRRNHARPRKLTPDQAAAIRASAAARSPRSLAGEFGVSHETVRGTIIRD